MLRYKFKHLQKHHRKKLNAKIYRATRNYDRIGELCQTIDNIIDIYVSNGDNTSDDDEFPVPDISNLLLIEMKKIRNDYKKMNLRCDELYSLMSNFAIKEKHHYNMNIHGYLIRQL